MASGPRLSMPHTSGGSRMRPRHSGSSATPSATALMTAAPRRCRCRRPRRRRAAPGPTAATCCRPGRSCRWGRATRCPRPTRMRVVRSVTASTVPVASPTSTMSPTPYWSSTSMKMPGQEVLHQALGAEAEGDARDAGAGDERAQVHPQLAEDHRDGDGPDEHGRRSIAAPAPASGRERPTAATPCPCRRSPWGRAS